MTPVCSVDEFVFKDNDIRKPFNIECPQHTHPLIPTLGGPMTFSLSVLFATGKTWNCLNLYSITHAIKQS